VLHAGKGIPEDCLDKIFRPEQKAILASGHSESEDVLKALSLRALTFIKKPYTILDMVCGHCRKRGI